MNEQRWQVHVSPSPSPLPEEKRSEVEWVSLNRPNQETNEGKLRELVGLDFDWILAQQVNYKVSLRQAQYEMGQNIAKEPIDVTQCKHVFIVSQASSSPPYNSLCSSVQKSSLGCHSNNDDGEDYRNGKNSGSIKVSSGAKSYQTSSNRLGDSHDDQNDKMVTEKGSLASKGAPTFLDYHRQEITIIRDNVPLPLIPIEATNLLWEDLTKVDQGGFSVPTQIHAQFWAIGLQGHNMEAIAKTGYVETLCSHLKQQCNDPKLGPTGYGIFMDNILNVGGQLTRQVNSSCSPRADTSDGNQLLKGSEYFQLLGGVMFKALQDVRLLDLPPSVAFYKFLPGR